MKFNSQIKHHSKESDTLSNFFGQFPRSRLQFFFLQFSHRSGRAIHCNSSSHCIPNAFSGVSVSIPIAKQDFSKEDRFSKNIRNFNVSENANIIMS